MSKTALSIPAAEANRSFSKLLRAARQGARIIITSHGEPVAVLGPIEASAEDAEWRRAAMGALEAHWLALAPITVGRWDRDDLYDRDRA